MKHSKLALIALTLASSLSATTAFADYRLTAFSDAVGFRSLVDRDMEEVKSTFASPMLKNMDYFEANNLCVAQILLKEFEAAITSCGSALDKAETSSELTVRKEKVAIAAVYSNLAVAKYMSGDATGASIDLEKALSLNEYDDNASINYNLISTNLIAGS